MLSQGLLRQSGHVISRFIKAVRACYLKVYLGSQGMLSQGLLR